MRLKSRGSILLIILLVVLVAIGILIYNNSNKSISTPPDNSSYGTPQSSNSNNSTKSTSNVIQIKTASGNVQYLATTGGYALYTYNKDTQGTSNCSGTCIQSWPIYSPGATTNLPSNITIITRSDGSKQYAYKGYPLYTFTGDSAGNVSGNGEAGFTVAKP